MAQRTLDPYGISGGTQTPQRPAGFYSTSNTTGSNRTIAAKGTNTTGAKNVSPNQTARNLVARGNANGQASIPTWGGSLASGYGKNTGDGSGYGYGSGSGDSGGGYGGGDWGYAEAVAPAFDPTAALMAALEAQRAAREQAVNAANAALDKQWGVAQDRYKASLAQMLADMQDLRNRASVQNFKAGKAQREALADRGAFNSGLGMQERLGLSSNLTNNLNRINTEEANQRTSMQNNLSNIGAQIDMQKAQNLASTINNYQDQVSSLITALFSNYAPSANYNSMLASLGGAGTTGLNNIVSNTAAGLNSNTGLYDTLLRYGNY